MSSFAGKMRLLQTALKQENYIVEIYTSQFYNPELDRFIKVIHFRHNKEEIFKSSIQIKGVKFLANLLNIVKEIPEDVDDREEQIRRRMIDG